MKCNNEINELNGNNQVKKVYELDKECSKEDVILKTQPYVPAVVIDRGFEPSYANFISFEFQHTRNTPIQFIAELTATKTDDIVLSDDGRTITVNTKGVYEITYVVEALLTGANVVAAAILRVNDRALYYTGGFTSNLETGFAPTQAILTSISQVTLEAGATVQLLAADTFNTTFNLFAPPATLTLLRIA